MWPQKRTEESYHGVHPNMFGGKQNLLIHVVSFHLTRFFQTVTTNTATCFVFSI